MGAFGKALALDPDVFTKKGGVGAILQQRSAPDPGLFNFLLAKFYAKTATLNTPPTTSNFPVITAIKISAPPKKIPNSPQ